MSSNTYNPAIPQPDDDQDVSQQDLLSNFSSLQFVYGKDHWPLFPSTANDGFHSSVTLPSFPNTIGTQPPQPTGSITPALTLFTQLVASVPTLFGITTSDNTPFPLLPATNNANPGSMQLGKVVLKWGVITGNTVSTGTANAAYDTSIPFSAAPYVTLSSYSGVSLGGSFSYSTQPTSGSESTSISVSWFTAAPGTTKLFYYIAIGPA